MNKSLKSKGDTLDACVHDFQLLVDPLEDIIIADKAASFNYCLGFFLRASIRSAHSSGRENLRTDAVLTLASR